MIDEKQLDLFEKPSNKDAELYWFHVLYQMIDYDLKEIGPLAMVVYLCIKRHCNLYHGQYFPSIAIIKEKSTLSETTIKIAIKKLVKFGYIKKEKNGRSYTYTLLEKVTLKSTDGEEFQTQWDYTPKQMQNELKTAYELTEKTIAELRNLVTTGKHGQTIIIPSVTINVNNQNNYDHSTGNIICNQIPGRMTQEGVTEWRQFIAKQKQEGVSQADLDFQIKKFEERSGEPFKIRGSEQ